MPSQIVLESISKSYGNQKILNKIDLTIKKGELITLLGPSGCGKTTVLRLVAGFLSPDNGRIVIGGKDVTNVPPNKRNTSMVFQSYALFPHMTVSNNIGFGLKMHNVPKDEAKIRINEMLRATQLETMGERYPRQLSGGQQQRVALARALVMRPSVLLLDEPLSNLDAKLRNEMRVEIRLLHEKLGLTTIFVTHDQEEALTMSDRIIILNQGNICQNGTPSQVFEKPKTKFVADFTAVRNFFTGKFKDNIYRTDTGLDILCESNNIKSDQMIGIRPNKICINPPVNKKYANQFKATLKIATYIGNITEIIAVINDKDKVIAELPSAEFRTMNLKRGDEIIVAWKTEDILYFTNN